ncbi:MAG: RdgB/HAM1 family non-canonical purine NTP pyrophosphatase [Candidatus Kapabacteria bacterium]|nr:RdgB/HAM1 family non-canonical purine NTP pyrophosphatase [Candidatus Kapabacteria bacterium]
MILLVATNNPHKAEELHGILKNTFSDLSIRTITDVLPEGMDVEETGATLEENAYLKAAALYAATGLPTIADDTGLEVDALDGKPGVRSARFAGENATYSDNVALLIESLRNVPAGQRTARFRTVMCYCDDIRTFFVEGECRGTILNAPKGQGGFGYDPVFVPDGFDVTFAQMDAEQKNMISHRGRALRAFAEQLTNYTT